MPRYLVKLLVDVEAAGPARAINDAVAIVISAGRVDGFDVDVQEIPDVPTQQTTQAVPHS